MTVELTPLVGERQNGESDSAVVACNDYLRMGPGRSLAELCDRYTDSHQLAPPTRSVNTLKQWSRRFGWQARAAEFDENWEAIKNDERRKVMDYGLALDYERVTKLKALARLLEGQIYERSADGVFHNIWVPDVKIVGRGDSAEVVDIERFNSALLSQYRETLADIAAEVGGRAKRLEHTGADGGALNVVVRWPEQDADDDA